MTAFFIPGPAGEPHNVESAYGEMRRQTEVDMGRRPSSRRISSLFARRGRLDCMTEVGGRDPVCDGTVIAIFDMGRNQPFVVWWQRDLARGDPELEILGCSVYTVNEFEA